MSHAEPYGAPGPEVTLAQTAALLLRGRELIAGRNRWTRRQYARDRRSRPVAPMHKAAFRFCAAGALIRAEGELSGARLDQLEDDNLHYIGPARFLTALDLIAQELLRRYTERGDPAELGHEAATISSTADTAAAQRRRHAVIRNLLDPLNDAKAIKHRDVLAAYDQAIDLCDETCARLRSTPS